MRRPRIKDDRRATMYTIRIGGAVKRVAKTCRIPGAGWTLYRSCTSADAYSTRHKAWSIDLAVYLAALQQDIETVTMYVTDTGQRLLWRVRDLNMATMPRSDLGERTQLRLPPPRQTSHGKAPVTGWTTLEVDAEEALRPAQISLF